MDTLFTLVGDPHLTKKSMDKMKVLCDQVELLRNPTVWLGDMLDTKEIIRGKCLNFWVDYFVNSKIKQHWIIVGNHDYFNLECESHSLETLKLIPNVTVVDTPVDPVNTPFYMIPYTHDVNILKNCINSGPKDSVLIGHLELKGFDYGNGRMCEDGLTLRSFKQYKRVISGHFHKYQNKGVLTYLGTPFSHSFGESNQDKFIATYDSTSDELKLIPTKLPQHKTIEINCDRLGELVDRSILPIEDELWKSHYYRIILTGKQENINKFSKESYTNNENLKLDIKFIERPSDIFQNDVSIEDTISNELQFIKWAKDIKQLDQETIKLGSDILRSINVK